jgi:hypothetical protein
MSRGPADPLRWPSLAGRCAVAVHLFGVNGFGRVRRWLTAELGRVDDDEFARDFSAHIRLPGIGERDFNHDCFEVDEEVILASSAANGYAAAGQSAWAHRTGTNAETLLVGAIDGHNQASRRTAVRAGRGPVLDATFVKLDRRASAQ